MKFARKHPLQNTDVISGWNANRTLRDSFGSRGRGDGRSVPRQRFAFAADGRDQSFAASSFATNLPPSQTLIKPIQPVPGGTRVLRTPRELQKLIARRLCLRRRRGRICRRMIHNIKPFSIYFLRHITESTFHRNGFATCFWNERHGKSTPRKG
jgi:hypothetical protein